MRYESGRLRLGGATPSGQLAPFFSLQPGLWLAWLVMTVAVLMAFAPHWFTEFNPLDGIAGAQRLAPQAGHWLGTDQLGRDVWSRIVYGAGHSLSAATAAVAMGSVVGTALGTVAGALGGRVEAVVMRIVDILLAIPSLLLSLTVIILLGFWHSERRHGGRRCRDRQFRPTVARRSRAHSSQRLCRSSLR